MRCQVGLPKHDHTDVQMGSVLLNWPVSVYRLREMPIQSCGQSVSAQRGKRPIVEIGPLWKALPETRTGWDSRSSSSSSNATTTASGRRFVFVRSGHPALHEKHAGAPCLRAPRRPRRAAISRRASLPLLVPPSAGSAPFPRPPPRGLHSSFYQLNLSAFCGIGGACRDCVARVKGVCRVCRVFLYVRHGSS